MKKLQIAEKWYILSEGNNCTLTFEEIRERKKKDSGDMESYTFTDEYYFPTVNDCLIRYLQLCQENAKDVQDCIAVTKDIFAEIKKLKF